MTASLRTVLPPTYDTAGEDLWASLPLVDMEHAENVELLVPALECMEDVATVVEFGAGVGKNLRAVRERWPGVHVTATEINGHGAARLHDVADVVYEGSIVTKQVPGRYDLVLAIGVLSCLEESSLPAAYAQLWEACGRYLLICDYYSEEPVVRLAHHSTYRDFAGEMVALYDDLKVISFTRCSVDPTAVDLRWVILERRKVEA